MWSTMTNIFVMLLDMSNHDRGNQLILIFRFIEKCSCSVCTVFGWRAPDLSPVFFCFFGGGLLSVFFRFTCHEFTLVPACYFSIWSFAQCIFGPLGATLNTCMTESGAVLPPARHWNLCTDFLHNVLWHSSCFYAIHWMCLLYWCCGKCCQCKIVHVTLGQPRLLNELENKAT